MPYVADPATREFLTRQAEMEGTDPTQKILEYEAAMGRMQSPNIPEDSLVATGLFPGDPVAAGMREVIGMSPEERERERAGIGGGLYRGARAALGAAGDLVGSAAEGVLGPAGQTVFGQVPTAPAVPPQAPEMGGPPTADIATGPLPQRPGDDDDEKFRASEYKTWRDEQTGREYDYDTERYKIRMQAAGVTGDFVGRAGVPGTGGQVLHGAGPMLTPREQLQRRVGMTREEREEVPPEFRGKHFRGGQEYRKTPEHLRGVGGAAARAAARGERGAFTASAALPDPLAPVDYVTETQTPAIQRAWFDNRAKSLGFRSADTEQKLQEARLGILEAQAEEAGLTPEEQAQRMTKRVREVYDMMSEILSPDVEQQVAEDMAMLLQRQPDMSPEMKRAAEQRLRDKHMSSNRSRMIELVAMVMGMQANPGAVLQALEQARLNEAMYGAGAAPLATPSE